MSEYPYLFGERQHKPFWVGAHDLADHIQKVHASLQAELQTADNHDWMFPYGREHKLSALSWFIRALRHEPATSRFQLDNEDMEYFQL